MSYVIQYKQVSPRGVPTQPTRYLRGTGGELTLYPTMANQYPSLKAAQRVIDGLLIPFTSCTFLTAMPLSIASTNPDNPHPVCTHQEVPL